MHQWLDKEGGKQRREEQNIFGKRKKTEADFSNKMFMNESDLGTNFNIYFSFYVTATFSHFSNAFVALLLCYTAAPLDQSAQDVMLV